MTESQRLGPLLHSFFVDHLITVKGLRPASVRSYRDTIRLLLLFVAADKRCKVTRLVLGDFTFDRVVAFLRYLEQDRGNHIRTRNQRLAAIHVLFEYIAGRAPEMLAFCQRVAAIPMKRVEVNVIRGWLGHADLTTTNRYAEINTKAKEAALRACQPPDTSMECRARPVWRSDEALMNWLASL